MKKVVSLGFLKNTEKDVREVPIDEKHVAYYLSLIKAGVQLDPPVVSRDLYTLDGRNRAEAYRRFEKAEVEVEILPFAWEELSKKEKMEVLMKYGLRPNIHAEGFAASIEDIALVIAGSLEAGLSQSKIQTDLYFVPKPQLNAAFNSVTEARTRRKFREGREMLRDGGRSIAQVLGAAGLHDTPENRARLVPLTTDYRGRFHKVVEAGNALRRKWDDKAKDATDAYLRGLSQSSLTEFATLLEKEAARFSRKADALRKSVFQIIEAHAGHVTTPR